MDRKERALSPDEFTELIVTDYPRLVRALALSCGDLQTAEDSVQEALMRAWERIDRGEEITSLVGWVAVVAMNETKSVFRRRHIERRARARLERQSIAQLAGFEHGPPNDPNDRRPGETVGLAVRSLPARQREVVVLHYFLDIGVASIADVLGLTAGAVKNALFNARQNLQGQLEDPGVDPDSAAPHREETHDG